MNEMYSPIEDSMGEIACCSWYSSDQANGRFDKGLSGGGEEGATAYSRHVRANKTWEDALDDDAFFGVFLLKAYCQFVDVCL